MPPRNQVATKDDLKNSTAPAADPKNTGSAIVAAEATGSNIIQFPGMTDIDLEDDAGLGANFSKDDLAMPFFKLLQDLSPETKKSKPEYVEGAKPGMFFNTVTKALYNGEDGVVFVPALYVKSVLEWKPNQGGFVKDHGEADGMALLKKAVRPEKGNPTLPNGNELVETAYHFGLVLGGEWTDVKDGEGKTVGRVFEPDGTAVEVLYTLKSSGLKISRNWNSLASGIKLPRKDGRGFFTPALAFGAYRITQKEVSNDEGTWLVPVIEAYKPVTQIAGGAGFYRQAIEFAKLMGDKPLPVDMTEAPSDDSHGGQTIDGSVNDEVGKAF